MFSASVFAAIHRTSNTQTPLHMQRTYAPSRVFLSCLTWARRATAAWFPLAVVGSCGGGSNAQQIGDVARPRPKSSARRTYTISSPYPVDPYRREAPLKSKHTLIIYICFCGAPARARFWPDFFHNLGRQNGHPLGSQALHHRSKKHDRSIGRPRRHERQGDRSPGQRGSDCVPPARSGPIVNLRTAEGLDGAFGRAAGWSGDVGSGSVRRPIAVVTRRRQPWCSLGEDWRSAWLVQCIRRHRRQQRASRPQDASVSEIAAAGVAAASVARSACARCLSSDRSH